jgi:MFS family permease
VDDEQRTELTYRYERFRAVAQGMLETAATTFLLLVAVRHFEAGSFAKALIAGGGGIGFILSPVVVTTVESFGWPTALAARRLSFVGAASYALAALFPILPVYVPACVLGVTCSSAAIPLLTQIYQENYPRGERGRRYSRTVMIRIATAALFSELAGRAISGHLDWFRWLLVIFAAAHAFAAFCLGRCPSRPLHVSGGKHPFRALKYAWTDRMFRLTLIMWMFMGFGNLMMLPLRVEYLANPEHGVTWRGSILTVAQIAFLTGVIPNVARLALSPLWGHMFDRINFFLLRLVLNVGFALGILAFFNSDTVTGLVLGSVVFGVSTAGGEVAWSLWVTKLAPPERVADYMSVHAFCTGLRGVTAPLVAFYLITLLEVQIIAWISVGSIVLGSLFLIPELFMRLEERLK